MTLWLATAVFMAACRTWPALAAAWTGRALTPIAGALHRLTALDRRSGQDAEPAQDVFDVLQITLIRTICFVDIPDDTVNT